MAGLHRFVHLGDLHLGPNSRNGDRLAALDQAVWDGRELPDLAGWLMPGDLNHGRMTIDDRNALITRVRLMTEKAPLFVCYGNHDLPGDLDFLSFLDTEHPVYVRSRPDVVRVQLPTGVWLSLFVLPYPTRAGLVAAGVAPDAVVGAAAQALDGIFLQAAAQLEDARAQGDLTMMIGHVNVAGSITSSGQPNIGREIEIDEAMLNRLGHIYKGLNHIHRRQFASMAAHYAGSMCRLDWGETEPKSYTVVTYGPGRSWGGLSGDGPDDGYPEGWAYDYEYRALDIAPMYHVEGDLTRDGFRWDVVGDEDAVSASNQGGPGFFEGAEVRVRYRFNAHEQAALDKRRVTDPFVGAKRLELDPIAVRHRDVRAPEVVNAPTLEAKVEAFVCQSRQAWTSSLADKLTALQHPDGAAFLTHVQRTLAPAPAIAHALEEVTL